MEFYACILLSLFLLTCISTFLRVITKKKKLPPGPTGLPVIGNLLAIGERPHESLTKLAKIYGSLMTVRLGFNRAIVASSVETAREILQKNDQAFFGRPIPDAIRAEKNYHMSLLWLRGGPKWRSLRKLCNTQIFTLEKLDALQELRDQAMDEMVKRVMEASEAGEAIEIGSLVFGTALNLLSKSMFSDDMVVFGEKSNVVENLKIMIARIMELGVKPNLSDHFPFLKSFDLQHLRRDTKACYDRLQELVEEVIDRRLKRRASQSLRCDDLLDTLLDQSKEHGTGTEFNHDEISILVLDLLIGGTDTTTSTTEWAMAELIRNPRVMTKAKQELEETIGSEKPIKEEDMPRLPYLQCILKETMRLHPSAALLPRKCTETDTKICGYSVPKDTQVFVNTWALMRDPDYWKNATEFIPERFMVMEPGEIDFRGTNLNFMPFGSGRRICPGLKLGVRMTSLLLGSLIKHFEWQIPDDGDGMADYKELDMTDKFGITLHKAIPLVAIPTVSGPTNKPKRET